MPGEVRRTQNWVAGTRPGNAAFVPPPPHLVSGLLADLEAYLHADEAMPPLVRTRLVHVQFETIHLYLDGNGCIGRLLVTVLLEHWRLLSHPLLYPSLYFKRHRSEYYRRLGAVRTRPFRRRGRCSESSRPTAPERSGTATPRFRRSGSSRRCRATRS